MSNNFAKGIYIALLGIAVCCNTANVRGLNNQEEFVDITCEKVICDYINEMKKKNIQNDENANVIAFECLVKIGAGEEHNAIIVLKNGLFNDPSDTKYLRTSASGIDVKTIPPVYYISEYNLMRGFEGIKEYALFAKKAIQATELEEKIAQIAALDDKEMFTNRDNLMLFNLLKSPELQFAALKYSDELNPIKLSNGMYITLTGIKDVTQIYAAFKPKYDDLKLFVNDEVSVSYFEDNGLKQDKTEKMDVFNKISCDDYCTREIQ